MAIKQVFAAYDWKKHRPLEGYKYCPFCRTQLTLEESGYVQRPICLSCGFVQYRNPFPVVCIMVVEGERVLLGKRALPPGKGKWAIPSGYIEYQDDFLTTGIREAREETGLKVEIASIFNVISSFVSPGYHFLTVYMTAHVSGGELTAGDDLEAVKWFSLSQPMPEMAFHEDINALELYAKKELEGIPVDPEFSRNRERI